jgi:hypothetical protein
MAAKFFTGLPLDGPDPECVRGHGEVALATPGRAGGAPRPSGDHSHRTSPPARPREPVPVTIGRRPPESGRGAGFTDRQHPPDRACDASPLAGFRPGGP